jgi:hydrogenase maturation protease
MNGSPSKNALVLGIGNILLADDGVGVHVIRRLCADEALPSWARAVDGGTMGFRLTGVLHAAGDVLIVDATDFGAAPGAIRLLDKETLAAHVAGSKKTSAHEAGLGDLLNLLRLENVSPRHLAVLAIQPRIVDWGERLSEPVAKAVDLACALAKLTVTDWYRT